MCSNIYDLRNWLNKAYKHFEMNQFDLAIQCLNKAIELDPGYTHAYINRGNVFEKKGELDKAISVTDNTSQEKFEIIKRNSMKLYINTTIIILYLKSIHDNSICKEVYSINYLEKRQELAKANTPRKIILEKIDTEPALVNLEISEVMFYK